MKIEPWVVLSVWYTFLIGSTVVIFTQLAIMWEHYIAPHIRSWRYERKMEKARQAFLAALEKEANK